MKPIDVTSDSYAECKEDPNEKNPKFKVGDLVRISKYKSIFEKGYTQNWPWVVPMKDKSGISIVSAFQKIISKRRKPNKIWVDQGGE